MLTIHGFLKALQSHYGEASIHLGFRFPTTTVSVSSALFSNMNFEAREQQLADNLKLDLADIRTCIARSYFRLELFPPGEVPAQRSNRGHYWLRMLLDDAAPSPANSEGPRAIHFYGYKGGQARSSVLAFLARDLAEDGWRILVVDVDAEAPSLPVLLGTAPSRNAETLVGLRAGLEPEPLRTLTTTGSGYADLLAFCLPEKDALPDAAALAMELAVSPPGAERLVRQVRTLADSYDLVLIDHRTGMAASVLPWVHGLRGPLVAFARMDGQWRSAAPLLSALWRQNAHDPGLLVSFKSDDERDITYFARVLDQARDALVPLADAMATPGIDVDVDDLLDRWVVWPYDPAFRQVGVPQLSDVTGGIHDALAEIRRLLSLGKAHHQNQPPKLSMSGAMDEGELILTMALRKLDVPNSPYWFIMGRKGTGKTRLVRELVQRGRGNPLLVADDDQSEYGVPAAHPSIKMLADKVGANVFWWHLIAVALSVDLRRSSLIDEIDRRVNAFVQGTSPSSIINEVRELARRRTTPKVLLLDGLETAFPRATTQRFIGELFRFWATIQTDLHLRSAVQLRIFIRTDLVSHGFENENIGQLLNDRSLYLSWDTQRILNYVLSRIRSRSWFRLEFIEVMKDIDALKEEIQRGELPLPRCDALLLRIFPSRIRRQNILTTTFLRIWFSDDAQGNVGYYPRIYDRFLGAIAEPTAEFSGEQIEDGFVSGALMLHAHEIAAKHFLTQVRTELNNLVDLEEGEIVALLDAFRRETTPFNVENLVEALGEKTNIDPLKIHQAMKQMKTLGIFEERSKYAGQWRAGRLFKTSLGMLYNRRRAS